MPAGVPRRKPSVPLAPPDIAADFAPLMAERHVALAVSGGSDSTALMHLATTWARIHHPGLVLSVLTVDHRLRPAAADEAEQVAAAASALGLRHETLSWDEDPKPRTGLQARARAARYALMAGWCRSAGASALLTGHTLDDQAETVLMRLARTTSPDSLAGVRPCGAWDGLPLLRPLLGVRRQALRDYLAGLGVAWIEDPSNADPRFERVRVRQSLVVSGTADVSLERLAALAARSARAVELLERMATAWIELSLREEEAGICHFAANDLCTLPLPLQERILGKIIARYGGGRHRPEAEELRRLAAWVARGEGPVRCTLGGAVLGRRKAGVWVTREAARIPAEAQLVPETGKALWDGRFLVEAAPGSRITAAAGRRPGGLEGVPVFARLSYPWVEQPAGAGEAPRMHFLRLAAR